ncbi:MAG: SGNH/GDSL hydrolase family protein [Acutalibacteraceae bacterium]|nr:SGNH/GDSL hydrolase family protein [Acutalibacteraceae bacterium]
MKKLLALLLVFTLVIGCFAGCSKGGETSTSSSDPVSSEDVSSEEPVSSEDESSDTDTAGGEDGDDYGNTDYPGYGEEPSVDNPPIDNSPTPSESSESNTTVEEPTEPELTAEEKRLESVLAGEDESLNKDAIYKEGDLTRLAKAIKKSKSGKEVLIMFYGNSANTSETYADTPYWRVFGEWWSANIGPCKTVAASMDNFTSLDACMRVDQDVLRWKPDVVFLDFAVQDTLASMTTINTQAYDNLIRRILKSSSKPAVVSLILTGAEQESFRMNAANANIFSSASKLQKQVASYYNIPIIDFENALWDNMVELVKVTTKMEIPLMTWATVGENNVAMNNTGHTILCGAITYLVDKVNKKLSKISTTKDYAYPTEGYFGTDKYMKGSLVDVVSIANGKASGYSFDLNKEKLATYGYFVSEAPTAPGGNPLTPYINTYRHYVPEAGASEADKALEENPHYLAVNMPEVKSTETVYFTISNDKWVSGSRVNNENIKKYAPITIECYDKDGNKISEVKKDAGYYAETIELGKVLRLQLPVGTTKAVIKIYTPTGTVRLLGVGYFK